MIQYKKNLQLSPCKTVNNLLDSYVRGENKICGIRRKTFKPEPKTYTKVIISKYRKRHLEALNQDDLHRPETTILT